MSIRISIKNNWKPPRLRFRALPWSINPSEWWNLSDLSFTEKNISRDEIGTAFYNQEAVYLDDAFGWNSTTISPGFSRSLDMPDETVFYAQNNTPADAFGWSSETLDLEFTNSFDYPSTGSYETLENTPDITWWDTASVTTLGRTVAPPASDAYEALQNQVTPADNELWGIDSIDTLSANIAEPTSYEYLADQETPEDVVWWDTSSNEVESASVGYPDADQYVYLADQETPESVDWWETIDTDMVVDSAESLALPTTDYDYDQDQATPADIGWWYYSGE